MSNYHLEPLYSKMGPQYLDINAKLKIIVEQNNNQEHITQQPQLDLPKISFQRLPKAPTKRYLRKQIAKKESYYHYQEPSPEELFETVEYDMDTQDSEWLHMFNDQHQVKYKHTITENDFEKIMDRLEKESFFQSKGSSNEIDEDAVCSICNDGDCANANAILFCDMCDLAVHQECYGVPYVPEGQWLCRRCLQSPSRNVECVLCPNKGGAFKQTDNNLWAHVICALWIPEVCFANTVFLEPIDSISQIPAARWKLTCYICKQKKAGACIQCHKHNCYVPFHVTCAQQAGLYMKIRTYRYNTPTGILSDVKKEAFCDLHSPKDHKNGGGMYESDDSDSDSYKKRKLAKRENMKKTRRILAEKRAKAFNPVAEPMVEEIKIAEISKLLTRRGSRKVSQEFEEYRELFIKAIHNYWILKRAHRNGVPLLRRLQVTYQPTDVKLTALTLQNTDKEKYERLRYDLEKARLLVGEVKKREILKKRMIKISKDIVEANYQSMDKEDPPTED